MVTPLSSANWNIPSAYTHPQVVHEYIQKELVDGNFIGPLPSPQLCGGQQTIHISRIRVVPKGHNTGKWQLITNLSYPPNRSVNDGISTNDCYTTVDKTWKGHPLGKD